MRQQLVGQQHRLRGLHVGASGHDRAQMRVRLIAQRLDDAEHVEGEQADLAAQPTPDQCRDLVIA
ncbi:hypothetical protein SDC9_149454 [bioreactor metagenome]|uniref:Uncharacterized protein n=1 Tax=bioreactor metagenome TaxID=1076179 RepID=A0A645ELL7_9ZZZZ